MAAVAAVMKEDAKVGGSVTGLRDALEGLPDYRIDPAHLVNVPVTPEEPEPSLFNDAPDADLETIYGDDMTAGLPGLGIRPLGVVGQNGGDQ